MQPGRRVPFFLLFFIFFAAICFGQGLPIKSYSFKDGLGSSCVYCIFQDSRGYMWFGTASGISRFDGLKFENFKNPDGMTKDLIRNIYEDKKKNLWFVSIGGGICVYDSHQFRCYTKDNGLASDNIYSVTGDPEGNLWFATTTGISKFDGTNFVSYDKIKDYDIDYARDIESDKDGNIWVGTAEGIFCLKKDGFSRFTKKDGLLENRIISLLIDHRQNLWIGTSKGLNHLDIKNGKIVSYTTANGLPDNHINDLWEDRVKSIWIATNNGLSHFRLGEFSNYYTKNPSTGTKIFSVFEDIEGNIWFATRRGVNKIISLKILNFTVSDGLPNSTVWSIIQDKSSRIWFGTDNGLSCYNNGKFKNYTIRQGLLSNSVYTLMEDRKGRIWIGTSHGLNMYHDGVFRRYKFGDYVLSLEETGDGQILVGTSQGLMIVKNGIPVNAAFDPRTLPVHAILEDSKQRLWFSNTEVLTRFSKSTGELKRFTTKDGLLHEFVHSLFEDSWGRIWICTRHGLNCFIDGKLMSFTTENGLESNLCRFVVEDNSKNLWVGLASGMNRINGQTLEISPAMPGLASYAINENAYLKDKQGNIWFTTVNGATKFSPQPERKNQVAPPVHISSFRTFKNKIPLNIAHPISLGYDQNYIEIGFTGLSFTAPEEIQYKYRLKGIDREWLETKNRSISYAYLPPGDYAFEVFARNRDGIESSQPATISFDIRPPFHQTLLFRIPAVLLLLTLVSLVIFWRIKRVREKDALAARNKQLVLAQKMELLGILAGGAFHDLKNLLTIIVNYSGMAAQSEEKRVKAIAKIQKAAASAVQMSKQILAFTRKDYEGNRPVNLPDLLEDIVGILKITVPPEIDVRLNAPPEVLRMVIDPTRFQQVVMNFCLNAVHAMPDGGTLAIRLTHNHTLNRAILNISDTGTGIPEDVRDKIFDPLFTTKETDRGTGLGLFVVKQIVDDYDGDITFFTESGKGTSFVVSFPLGTNNN